MNRYVFAVSALLFSTISLGSAEAASFSDFPILVHCERAGIERVFYLTTIDDEGNAIYASPDRQAGTVSFEGTAKPVGTEPSGSCAGKTIDELRASGQAFDLPK